jgi:hypothetical protein
VTIRSRQHQQTTSRALPLLLAAIAAIGACSSDDFSGVGGSLPTDVSQDSLEILLPPVYLEAFAVVTPIDTVPGPERPALYLGDRPEGSWRGTPLLRFDVGDSLIQEMVPADWNDVVKVQLRLKGMVQDAEAAVVREVSLYELANPLAESDLLVDDASTLFGPVLTTATFNVGNQAVDLPREIVQGWFEQGTHNGIAIDHVSPDKGDLYSNFAGYAGNEFTSGSRVYSTSESIRPELFLELRDNSMNFEVPVLLDLGHLIQTMPDPAVDPHFGSYFERRLWLKFDIGPDIVPTDATINAGTLVMRVREDLTMQVRPYSQGPIRLGQEIRAWEAIREEAGDDPSFESAYGEGGREIIGGVAAFNPDPGAGDEEPLTEWRLDVTEYVQRQVNEIVPNDLLAGATVNDVGLLLGFTRENLDLCLGVFYGPDAPDSLKPRLEITYTPPADSWR